MLYGVGHVCAPTQPRKGWQSYPAGCVPHDWCGLQKEVRRQQSIAAGNMSQRSVAAEATVQLGGPAVCTYRKPFIFLWNTDRGTQIKFAFPLFSSKKHETHVTEIVCHNFVFVEHHSINSHHWSRVSHNTAPGHASSSALGTFLAPRTVSTPVSHNTYTQASAACPLQLVRCISCAVMLR